MSSDILKINNSFIFASFDDFNIQKKNNQKSALESVSEAVNKFRFTVWPYVKEATYVVRSTLKIIAVEVENCSELLVNLINKIKIIYFVSFVFSIQSTYEAFKNILKEFSFKDEEAIVFSILSALASIGGLIENLMTSLSSLELGFGVISLKDVNDFYSPFSLPLVLTLITYSVLKSTYDSIIHALEISQLPAHVDENTLMELKAVLKEKMGVSKDEKAAIKQRFEKNNPERKALIKAQIKVLKAKKIHILERRTDVKIVNMMQNLKKDFKNNSADVATVNLVLKDIKDITFNKIASNSCKSFMNVAKIVALVGATFFGFSPLVTPIVGVIRGLVNMGHNYYQSHKMYSQLGKPEYSIKK